MSEAAELRALVDRLRMYALLPGYGDYYIGRGSAYNAAAEELEDLLDELGMGDET